MKAKLKMALMCLCAVVVLSLASCGSKVNQDELNKKIEAMGEDGKLDFTDAEYEFMAKYLLDIYSADTNAEPSQEETEKIFGYGLILVEADSQGLIKGNAKKIYDEAQSKMSGMINGHLNSSTGNQDLDAINKKIQDAKSNGGMTKATFTDQEYELMAQYLWDKFSGMDSLEDYPVEEDRLIGEYAAILSIADFQDKLSGNAKNLYDKYLEKSRELME